MTILFSHLAGQHGMVFSFEAQVYCFAILQKNIRANYRENVRAIYGAVLDGSREEVSFVEPGLNRFPSYGSYPLKLKVDESSDHLVKTLTIDELQIDRPISFVKVDVQCSDLFVLGGGRETMLQHQMPILFEYEEQFQKEFGTTFEDYIDFIRSINYRVEEVVDGINYLIVPDRKRAVLSNHTSPSAVQSQRRRFEQSVGEK
jgi:FkbM family methyltransferase